MQNAAKGGLENQKAKRGNISIYTDQKQGNRQDQPVQSWLQLNAIDVSPAKAKNSQGAKLGDHSADHHSTWWNCFHHDWGHLLLQKNIQAVIVFPFRVLQCRDDFKSLNTIFESFDIESPTKQHLQLKDDDLSDRKSFSRLYMQEFDRNSVEGSSEKIETPMFFQPEEKVKMISEGYILRNKYNSGNYEKIYLKLKKSVLYIYVNEKSERSQNTIQIEDIE